MVKTHHQHYKLISDWENNKLNENIKTTLSACLFGINIYVVSIFFDSYDANVWQASECLCQGKGMGKAMKCFGVNFFV